VEAREVWEARQKTEHGTLVAGCNMSLHNLLFAQSRLLADDLHVRTARATVTDWDRDGPGMDRPSSRDVSCSCGNKIFNLFQ